jgi:hypothetical protein
LGKNIIWLLVILVLLLILMRSCILVNRLVVEVIFIFRSISGMFLLMRIVYLSMLM